MKLQSGYEKRRARVEMLPLIDVVFLLLVFFIYAMLSMVLHRGLAIQLPAAGSAVTDVRDYLAITITADNLLFINQRATSLEQIVADVKRFLADSDEELPIYIEGDRDAGLGIAVSVLDRLRAAGIEQVAFSCSEHRE